MRKNSIKNIRINREVRREMSEIIRTEVKDPRLQGIMISVTGAEVSPDLKYCKVFISILGSREEREAALEGLNRAEGFIRRELARRVNLRNTPELAFVPDNSIENGVRITRIIDDVTKDLKEDGAEELKKDSTGEPEEGE